MNDIDVKNYINPRWDVSDIIVNESQDLVEKWKPLMDYESEKFNKNGEFFTKVEEKDRLKTSRNLEFLDIIYNMNFRQAWPENDVYTKQMIAFYRADATVIRKENKS